MAQLHKNFDITDYFPVDSRFREDGYTLELVWKEEKVHSWTVDAPVAEPLTADDGLTGLTGDDGTTPLTGEL